MSDPANPLTQPKVRFTQAPEDSKGLGPFQGPKIREVVILKHPVKLIRSAQEESSLSEPENVVPNLRNPPRPLQPEVKPNSSTLPSSSEDSRRPKKPSHDLDYLQKKLEELKMADKQRKKPPQPTKKPPDPKKIVNSPVRIPSKSILKPKNAPSTQNKPGRPSGIDRKIENKENVNKKVLNTVPARIDVKKSKTIDKKENNYSSVSKGHLTSVRKPRGGGCPPREATTSGRRSLGLMPCMKGKKTPETKRNEVKVLRRVARPIPQVFVGPGVFRDRGNGEEGDEKVPKIDSEPGDLLRRPEYNSIVCTIKKLEEVRRKKVVGNLDNLPGGYKDLVNGKISSALDIPPSESVYHDLVDISVDEKQLPMRLTRSKDPEPRPKDFIPNLSDFFIPQYPKEYSEAFRIRPRTSESIDEWSGFSVSDKINHWKMSLDEPTI
ncbi:muscle M-line assembly protein unc-89-like [Fopius arisanus]|uniref:Muscle M-line assembly protein unc-89-like n=1 Tax=Fopius arisanus TaxID=64838 RepID=A0A9R1T8F2_9HYME|nr:PREDICTED: muscle M-line assembly protein unc-89-like [Fopius arisanus]